VSTTLLVDGDQYLYKCCAATERDVKWDDENHIVASNEEEAWDTLQASLGELKSHFGAAADIVICMGEAPYFRHALHAGYKAGRSRKPLCFYDVRQRLRDEYRCVEMPGIEADDVMGILATRPKNRDNSIIVARDKDMKGVPAKVWDGATFHNISEYDANYFHLYQTLTGDVTDGYKGCPGIGPKKAEALLPKLDKDNMPYMLGEWWARVRGAFEKAGLTEADALLQARLARILRWSDWDGKTKQPILWTPKS
jgi:5'-3' exonuclease